MEVYLLFVLVFLLSILIGTRVLAGITSTSVLGQFGPWSLWSFLKVRSDQGPN